MIKIEMFMLQFKGLTTIITKLENSMDDKEIL